MNRFDQFMNNDYILNNITVLMAEKIFSLIELWNKISEFDFDELQMSETIKLMDWALVHTLNIILTGEWIYYTDLFETQLSNALEKASQTMRNVSGRFERYFERIFYALKNSWNIPILDVIIKNENVGMSKNIIEFFDEEKADLIAMRLLKLCESQCQDLALNLSTAFLRYIQFMEKEGHLVEISPKDILFILDIRISLLYRWGRIPAIEEAVSQMNDGDFKLSVERFMSRDGNMFKTWQHSQKLAMLMMQIYLEQNVVNTEHESFFIEMLEYYLKVSIATDNLEEFFTKVRSLSDMAEPFMLQNMCDLFKNVNNRKVYAFTAQMFIKTINADMNEIEAQKVNEQFENEEERRISISVVTSRLAAALDKLAIFLQHNVKIARECALTAFSLEPTADRLYILENLAEKSGLPVLDQTYQWKCKLHPLSSPIPNAELLAECSDCQEYMRKFQPDIPMRANLTLYEAIQTLDLPETICDDLIVCISHPRYQILNWYLPWMVLYRLCVMYLRDPMRTRNCITKLHYVDIDYSKFGLIQEESCDPYEGIEEGYEKYLNPDYDSDRGSTTENSPEDGDDYDPNSIESLKKILSLENTEDQEKEQTDVIDDEKRKEQMCYGLVGTRSDGKAEKGFNKLKKKLCFFGKKGDKSEKDPGKCGKECTKQKKTRSIFGKKNIK